MKERPILFTAPMVRAILEGRKTQTRRIVELRRNFRDEIQDNDGQPWPEWVDDCGDYHRAPCPRGQPGDRLWVREAWAVGATFDNIAPSRIGTDCIVAHKATHQEIWPPLPRGRWRPSIHMPRWASRITLEITGVRVQRLQDISREDAIAEGIERHHSAEYPDRTWWKIYRGTDIAHADPIYSYQTLWESINGPGSWEANPWVWALAFEPLAADA